MIGRELAGLAEAELFEAARFYTERSPGRGDEFLADFEHCLELLQVYPELGAPHRRGTRRLVLQHFPYSIIYHALEDRILVIAVTHHRRDPDYWKDRVDVRR